MKMYEVYGHATIICAMTVEAESEEEAIEIANNEFGGLSNYSGMGGVFKRIGVSSPVHEECIIPDDDVVFDDCVEL